MSKYTYLAGPMTGYPQFNYPAFIAAAQLLREEGFNIHSPVEMDDPEVREAALASPDGKLDEDNRIAGHTWGFILGKDVEYLADRCDSIVLLPGWERSKGARLEAFTACNLGYKLYYFNEHIEEVLPVRAEWVLDTMRYIICE